MNAQDGKKKLIQSEIKSRSVCVGEEMKKDAVGNKIELRSLLFSFPFRRH